MHFLDFDRIATKEKGKKLVTEATLVSSLSQWMNIEFVWWWALLLLPLPWIIFKFFPEETQQAEIKLAYLPDSQHNSKPKQLVQKPCLLEYGLYWSSPVLAPFGMAIRSTSNPSTAI